jgi:chromosome segregation ATPase
MTTPTNPPAANAEAALSLAMKAALASITELRDELAAEKERHTDTQKSVVVAVDRANKAEAELAAMTQDRDELRYKLGVAKDGIAGRDGSILILESQRDAARAELAAIKAGAVTDSHVYQALKSLAYFKDSNGDVVATFGSMRAALQAVVGAIK